jgi:hypothetical protein
MSRRYTHLFEEFFVIGANKDDISKLNWSKIDAHKLNPETLYLHNWEKDSDCDRRRVVKDFCFPDGIEVKKLKKQSYPS